MRHLQQSLGFAPPVARRGIIPLLIAGGIGAGRAIYGAIQANQLKQRQRGYVNVAYQRASRDLKTRQDYAREASSESLAARGLMQGGAGSLPPIHAAMLGQKPGVEPLTSQATSLAGQVKANEETQMGYERTDLDEQRDQSNRQIKSTYNNALLDSAVKGVETGGNVYVAGQDMSTLAGGAGAAGGAKAVAGEPAPTSKLLAGASFGGIHPTDPLGDEASAWHPSNSPIHQAIVGDGQPNYAFQVG